MTAIFAFARKFFGIILGVLLALSVVIGVLAWLGLRVDLSMLREPIQVAARHALGREVILRGPVALVPSLSPTIEVAGVSIANPPGFGEGDFASAGLLRLQVEILPLLSGEFRLDEFVADKVRLNLRSNASGQPNWLFADREVPQARQERVSASSPQVLLTTLDSLSLSDVQVSYTDQAVERSIEFRVDELEGTLPEGESLDVTFRGELDGRSYDLTATLGRRPERGEAWPLDVRGEFAGTAVESAASVISGGVLEVKGALTLGQVDVGGLLHWLGIVDDVRARVGALRADLHVRGDSLSEILADSTVSVRLEEGAWRLRDANTGNELEIAVDVGEWQMLPGQPIAAGLDARIGRLPLKIKILGALPADYLKRGTPLSLRLDVQGSGAELVLEARGERPLNVSKLGFRMSLKGDNIASLSDLLDRDLPPFGPYLVAGRFAIVPTGYEIRDLEVRIADTNLKGDFRLDTAGDMPHLTADLRSKRLQLNDFGLRDWSPVAGDDDERSGLGAPAQGDRATADQARRYALLDGRALRAQDLTASLVVDEVLSGTDMLGSGSLKMRLHNGRLQIDPLSLAIPGGEAQLRFSYVPTGSALQLGLEAKVEQFDYGVLARRIDAESKVDGRLSLDVGITASGSSLEDLLANGNGHLDFAVWPGQLNADIFELWAVNVLTSLAEEMDGEEQSRVNCIIARFKLDNGVMNDRIIFADTTRMSVEGTAQVDFNARNLKVRVRPKPKRAEFFSLATPVGLSGPFEDYNLRINPIELGGSAVSFITSPLHVPLRRLFGEDGAPPEGEQGCVAAWTASDALTADDGPTR